MPALSFFQLARIFIAGFVGYSILLCLSAIGTVVLFPRFVRVDLDMSYDTFYLMVFCYLGVSVFIATPLMLGAAWCGLRLLRGRV